MVQSTIAFLNKLSDDIYEFSMADICWLRFYQNRIIITMFVCMLWFWFRGRPWVLSQHPFGGFWKGSLMSLFNQFKYLLIEHWCKKTKVYYSYSRNTMKTKIKFPTFNKICVSRIKDFRFWIQTFRHNFIIYVKL